MYTYMSQVIFFLVTLNSHPSLKAAANDMPRGDSSPTSKAVEHYDVKNTVLKNTKYLPPRK